MKLTENFVNDSFSVDDIDPYRYLLFGSRYPLCGELFMCE
ncbi:MAG: hypothetical protein ACJAZM_002541 [Cyclobacteriaceae bacterium]|jgi:hypothetical protein